MSTQSGFDIDTAPDVAEVEEEGQVVHLEGLDGEPLYHGEHEPVTLRIAGSYSSRYRRAEEAALARRIKSRSQVGPAVIRRDTLAVAAACVIDWAGFFKSGEPLACTKDNVLQVFKRAPHFANQALTAMEDHAGFFENSLEN